MAGDPRREYFIAAMFRSRLRNDEQRRGSTRSELPELAEETYRSHAIRASGFRRGEPGSCRCRARLHAGPFRVTCHHEETPRARRQPLLRARPADPDPLERQVERQSDWEIQE